MSQPAKHFMLTRRTTVAECDRSSVIDPILVGLDFSLLQVIESFERSPRTQTIAVVDGAGKLRGIIPLSQIIDDIFLEICPEEFLADINDLVDLCFYFTGDRNPSTKFNGRTNRIPLPCSKRLPTICSVASIIRSTVGPSSTIEKINFWATCSS